MTRISEVERPGLAVRAFYRDRPGDVRQGADAGADHGPPAPLMMGLGALYGSLEWFGRVEATAARPAQRARRRAVRQRLLNGHPSRRRREGGHPAREARRAAAPPCRATGSRRVKKQRSSTPRRSRASDQEVTDACVARLREHFSEAEVVELTFIVGYQTFASKFAKAFRLAPQGFAASA